jgi:uncharacterized protein (DUF433 family)
MDGSENKNFNLIGIGLYTVAEAARLTGISKVRLRGWPRGYAYRSGEVRTTSVPVWRRQVPEIDGTLGLGFLDLMEARFVDAFRAASVPLRVIRLCAERAREVTGRDHPFSSRCFRTDGRTIFADVVDHAGEQQLLDLAKNQLAFARVIGPSLYAGLEFSVDDMPARWWPMGSKREIVIDPKRSFGQPIVSDGGVPTTVLLDAVEAEGSIAKVASLFALPQHSVRAALRYEKRLADRLVA